MALQATVYRFKIELSDIDRSLYESTDFRLAMHPSESPLYLMTRALAFVLNLQPGLEFSAQGLGDPDQPPLSIPEPRGGLKLWIEIGNPGVKRLHMASKAATHVKVYTYKDPRLWLQEMQVAEIFQFQKIEIYSFKADFLNKLADALERNNDWGIVHQDHSLSVQIKNESIQGEIQRHWTPAR